MTRTKATVFTLLFAVFLWTGVISISKEAAAAEIDWQKYMQSAANISAIAAAVAWVDDCGEKLIFKESNSEGNIRLDVICNGDDNKDATSSIEFKRFGKDGLIPSKFSWAG